MLALIDRPCEKAVLVLHERKNLLVLTLIEFELIELLMKYFRCRKSDLTNNAIQPS